MYLHMLTYYHYLSITLSLESIIHLFRKSSIYLYPRCHICVWVELIVISSLSATHCTYIRLLHVVIANNILIVCRWQPICRHPDRLKYGGNDDINTILYYFGTMRIQYNMFIHLYYIIFNIEPISGNLETSPIIT